MCRAVERGIIKEQVAAGRFPRIDPLRIEVFTHLGRRSRGLFTHTTLELKPLTWLEPVGNKKFAEVRRRSVLPSPQ